MIYVIGSLRNPNVAVVSNYLRSKGFDIFDDWYSPGPEADDRWQGYEAQRGRSFAEALAGAHAKNVFDFDYEHLEKADTVVLVLPAGKSAHLELGWCLGKGKKGYILLPDVIERFDIMYKFATGVASSVDELIGMIRNG